MKILSVEQNYVLFFYGCLIIFNLLFLVINCTIVNEAYYDSQFKISKAVSIKSFMRFNRCVQSLQLLRYYFSLLP